MSDCPPEAWLLFQGLTAGRPTALLTLTGRLNTATAGGPRQLRCRVAPAYRGTTGSSWGSGSSDLGLMVPSQQCAAAAGWTLDGGYDSRLRLKTTTNLLPCQKKGKVDGEK